MNCLDSFRVKIALPLFAVNFPPNTIIKSFLKFVIIQIRMNIGQQLWNFIEQIDKFFLRSTDYFLQNFFVDNPVSKFELLDNDSDNLGIVLEIEEHIADLFNQVGLYIRVLEEIVLLDVNFE